MASVAAPTTLPANERIVLHDVSWETYANLRANLGDHPIRLTYDGSNLEIMSPSRWHELAGRFLGRMITTMAGELNIQIGTGGSTTFQQADQKRGLEPDECFWIANEARVRGKRDIDLTVDPPPDLAIEIDISPSRLNRPGIYAAIRVPEIWRFDGEELHAELLQRDGKYQPAESSKCFPFLPLYELTRFLLQVEQSGEINTMQSFVQWLREQNFRV
jgi:Uma2 family endonuclease